MSYDVVVVGGGVGGLTVAALLSARGFRTCLLERQSQVGGCIGRIKHSSHEFEPGMGIYPGFGSGEIYDRIFSELPVAAPSSSPINTDYVVRLAGDTDVRLFKDDSEFFAELTRAFPECDEPAVAFYKLVGDVHEGFRTPSIDKPRRGILDRLLGSPGSKSAIPNLQQAHANTTLSFAGTTSARFQRFVDAQLRAFQQTGIDCCSFAQACKALSTPRRNLYSLNNGVAELAERLAESIKKSGGVVRLNSPVLRLAYSELGTAIGVDLLSGETVLANKAIVSNLTTWDTYGRLVGLQRTPSEIKSELQKRHSSGVYVVYATIEEETINKLPARNFLVVEDRSEGDDGLGSEFTVSIGSTLDGEAPATIKTSTDVVPWFSFQTSEEDYEERDQEALEQFWSKLHRAMPELGSGIEIIETANPRSYYDQTRRKLGMVMGTELPAEAVSSVMGHITPIPKLFMIGDTIGIAPAVESVAQSALDLVTRLSK